MARRKPGRPRLPLELRRVRIFGRSGPHVRQDTARFFVLMRAAHPKMTYGKMIDAMVEHWGKSGAAWPTQV